MHVHKILRCAIFSSLVLGLIQGAGTTRAESPCAKEGPFAPRVDEDLRRKDLVIESVEMPRVQEKRKRSPSSDAERGVCQDAQTGKTIITPDPPPGSGQRANPGGDEGDPSLPRGDDRDRPRGKERQGAAPSFLLASYVFGDDDRVLQSPTTSFPFRAVIKLLIKFPNTPSGKARGCTGSFIGDKHVLTAGHCVFQSGQGGWATSIRAIPGLNGVIPPFNPLDEPFGEAFMVARRSVTCWTQDGDTPDCDYGLITLNKTFNVGSFGLLYLTDGDLENTWAQLIGYPGKLGNPDSSNSLFQVGGLFGGMTPSV
jgi:hypothetical protein